MSKLDKKPMQQAQLSKYSHDLSHTYDYTSSTGMILPLVHDLLNPGESVQCKIDLSDTRTMPLQAAAYLDLDLHVDYFFVPMDMIFSNFNSFIYRIKEYYSSANFPHNNLPLMNLANYKADIYTNYSQDVITGNLGLNFDELAKGSTRLFEHLGYGTLRTGVQTFNPNVFPYALCAYNAIYQYYFRNDEYEPLNQACYNLDNLVLSNVQVFDEQDISSRDFCSLRYRDKYHDYFTRVQSSPIVSANNVIDSAGSLSLAKSWLSRESSDVLGQGPHSTLIDGWHGINGNTATPPDQVNTFEARTNFGFNTGPSFSTNPTYAWNSPNGQEINTANLRALFANEKLWTITGMNRKQYDAQTLAHYGYDVPVDVMHQCQHIGHHLYQVHVGEVISTSGTATQPLATVAGKGYAFENKDGAIKFTAPCHGVFMAVYSSAIHRNYFNNFRKENAVATWQDFYQPEFDHLGMQPLFRYEALQDNLDDTTLSPSTLNASEILGWQYRYEQFKCRYDRASMAFASGFRSYTSGPAFYGPFSSWAPSELAYESSVMINNVWQPSGYWRYVLKENPCELNHIMAVAYDPAYYTPNESQTLNYYTNPWQLYATDPLVHHAFIDYKKLSTMSLHSMPRMDA